GWRSRFRLRRRLQSRALARRQEARRPGPAHGDFGPGGAGLLRPGQGDAGGLSAPRRHLRRGSGQHRLRPGPARGHPGHGRPDGRAADADPRAAGPEQSARHPVQGRPRRRSPPSGRGLIMSDLIPPKDVEITYETETPVAYAIVGPVAWITMDRTAFHNAQNSQMTYALDDAFRR